MQATMVGFTGTQRGMTDSQRESVIWLLSEEYAATVGHHGDCIGADAQFHDVCIELGIPVHVHPPNVDSKRAFCDGAESIGVPKPYLDRNHDIVDACDLLIATPSGPTETRRSGTWATVRHARKRNKIIAIVLLDGAITVVS